MKTLLFVVMLPSLSLVSCSNGPAARQGTVIGAVTGGVAGGLIGRDLGGVVAGAGIGALAGNMIGGARDRRRW
ncbi:MAG: hypothetical protein B7Z37_29095 [Verrucomicrobia bacterium 12-59-8]|nr:MAG: hypothetical protein B7Z37_29095 [Verrucomicrobia bacterium 12-59-8]